MEVGLSGPIEISAALHSRLTAAAPGAAIEAARIKYLNLDPGGKTFTPPSSGLWYEPFFLPGEVDAAGIGEQAPNRHVGIFQVVIHGPKGKGTKATDDEGERLRKCYPRGQALVYSGVVVQIVRSWVYRPSDQDDPAWFKQILRVEWSSDVAN